MIDSTQDGPGTRRRQCAEDAHEQCSGKAAKLDGHPLQPVIANLAELRESLLHYFEARKDKTKGTIRRLVTIFLILLSVGITWMTALVAATILLVSGMAEAVGIALGDRPWAGDLAVGVGFVLTTVLMAMVLSTWLSRSARERAIRKYELRRRIRHEKFTRGIQRQSGS